MPALTIAPAQIAPWGGIGKPCRDAALERIGAGVHILDAAMLTGTIVRA